MKKIILLCLFMLAAFTLVACSSNKSTSLIDSSAGVSGSNTTNIATTKSPAEQFIDTATNEQLNKIIFQIHPVLINNDHEFSSVNELTSWELFNFYINNFSSDSDKWYNKDDKCYHIPLKDIIAVLNQYFEGYTFDPHKISSEKDFYNNKKEDAVVVSAYGLSSYVDCEIETLKAISGNKVEIDTAFYDRIENPESTEILYKRQLILKITDDGYRYVSYVKI